jgi:hypothetical protein
MSINYLHTVRTVLRLVFKRHRPVYLIQDRTTYDGSLHIGCAKRRQSSTEGFPSFRALAFRPKAFPVFSKLKRIFSVAAQTSSRLILSHHTTTAATRIECMPRRQCTVSVTNVTPVVSRGPESIRRRTYFYDAPQVAFNPRTWIQSRRGRPELLSVLILKKLSFSDIGSNISNITARQQVVSYCHFVEGHKSRGITRPRL